MTPDEDALAPIIMPIAPGEVVADKYRIVRRLGQGGMGAVFEAQHTLLERRFAIKFLRPQLAGSADMLTRFRREALAAGRVEHDHVVAVTDFGVLPTGVPYLVMEYLAGEPLSALLQREGPLTVPRAVSLVVQACSGVMAAHAQGVVHRDLKPDNLFVCLRGGREHVKVVDFGIAKLKWDSACGTTITRTGASLGTPHYMSPEQARGESSLDQRTDVYSLGAVLYECLCGRRPHPGNTYNGILFHILTRQPVPLAEQEPMVPPGLASVVERAMAPAVGDRYGRISELWHALLPYAPVSYGLELDQGGYSENPHLPTAASPSSLGAEQGAQWEGSLRPVLTLDAVVPRSPRPARRTAVALRRWAVPAGGVMLLVALGLGIRQPYVGQAREAAPASSMTEPAASSPAAAQSVARIDLPPPHASASPSPSSDAAQHPEGANSPSGAASSGIKPRYPTSPAGQTPRTPKPVKGIGSSAASPRGGVARAVLPGAYDERNPYQ